MLIAYGDKAFSELTYCVNSLKESNPHIRVTCVGDRFSTERVHHFVHQPRFASTNPQKARWAKTNLFEFSPYDYTLYIDVDCRVYGDLSPIFGILRDGGELVITPADGQHGANWLWHVSQPEREATAESMGFYAQVLQGGVFAFRKTEAVEKFFAAWQTEYMKYKGEDQAALIRALQVSPVRLWLLGQPFNGTPGTVISHLFGRTREETK